MSSIKFRGLIIVMNSAQTRYDFILWLFEPCGFCLEFPVNGYENTHIKLRNENLHKKKFNYILTLCSQSVYK